MASRRLPFLGAACVVRAVAGALPVGASTRAVFTGSEAVAAGTSPVRTRRA